MNLELAGKRALVTGSTAGIGYAIARGLAKAGAAVTLNGRSEDRLVDHRCGAARRRRNYPFDLVRSRKELIVPETATSLSGRTFTWKFTEGPTAGSAYEHMFLPDGSVEFRKLDDTGGAKGKPTHEKRYGSFEVAPKVYLVSYLAASGYTLTVAMNLDTGRLYGFASNDKEWHPVSGTLEIVK